MALTACSCGGVVTAIAHMIGSVTETVHVIMGGHVAVSPASALTLIQCWGQPPCARCQLRHHVGRCDVVVTVVVLGVLRHTMNLCLSVVNVIVMTVIIP